LAVPIFYLEDTMPNPHIGAHAASGGRAKASKHLTVEKVQAAFGGPLQTPEDAKRRLELIGEWTCGGLLPGSVAGSACRSVEVWLKCYESEIDRERLKTAEARIGELEAEVAAARQGRMKMGVI
jgi:hypothetical protein